jgi:hypothetical protein
MRTWLRLKIAEERERRRIGLGTVYAHFRWVSRFQWDHGWVPCFCWRIPPGKDHTWPMGPKVDGIRGQRHVLLESWLGWK